MATALLVIKIGNGLHDGTVDTSTSQHLGALFQGLHSVAVTMIYLVTSVLGTILSFLLYRSQLVPREK